MMSALGVPAMVVRPTWTVWRGFVRDLVLTTRVRVFVTARGAPSVRMVPARAAILRVARAVPVEFCGATVRGAVLVRAFVSAGRVLDAPSRTAEYAGAPGTSPIIAHKIRILFISVVILSKIQKWVNEIVVSCFWTLFIVK